MKKRIGMVALASMLLVLMLTGYAFAASFSDTNGHWAEQSINKWAAQGLAGGYLDGTFKPDASVTRAEFVALINRTFNIEKTAITNQFADVEEGQWYYSEISAAKSAGYIGGYSDGSFKPNQTISRQEVASILVRLLKLEATEGVASFTDAGQIQQWAQSAVGAVVKSGLMRGFPDNTFMPLKSITRAEAVVTLDRALGNNQVVSNGLEGKVTFNGKNIANAVVKVFAADSYQVLKDAKTDNNGNFKVALEKGKYDITVTTENEVGYQSDLIVADNKLSVVTVSLEKAAVLSGNLEDKNGRTVKNGVIAFTTNPTFVTSTDKDGKYTLATLPNHAYTVRAYNPDKKDPVAEVVIEGLSVGAVGKQAINTLKAPFEVKSSSGGGGGGGTSETIKEIKDLYQRVKVGDSFTLPTTVQATMNNSSTKQVSVTWSPATASTSKAGVFSFEGTVSGYNTKVKLILVVEAPLGQTVTVEAGKPVAFEGGITLTGLPAGSTIAVQKAEGVINEPGVIEVAGQAMKFTFGGVVPPEGVTLSILTNSNEAVLCYYNPNSQKWEMQEGSKIVTAGNEMFVEAKVIHFSTYGPLKKTAKLVADNISPIVNPTAGATSLTLPKVLDGFAVGIKTSDRLDVIALDGTITPPAVKTTVKLTLEVTKVGTTQKATTAELTVEVPAYDASMPIITEITNAKNAKIDGNTITIPMQDLTKETGLKVSKDSKMEFAWEGLGPFKGFELKKDKANNIYNIALPTTKFSDVKATDFAQIFDALKKCDPATRDEIIDAFNFTALFKVIQDTSAATRDDIIDQIHFTTIFSAVTNSIYKDVVYNNLNDVLELVRKDNSMGKTEIVGAIDPALLLAVKETVITAEERKAILDGDTSVITFTELFDKVKASGEDTQEKFFNAIKFEQLFNGLKNLTPTIRDDVFESIDFTTMFKTVQGADEATKEVVFNDVVAILNILKDSSVTRTAIIDAVDWSGLDRTCLFNWFSQIDANDEYITINVTLQDPVNSTQTNTYTININ